MHLRITQIMRKLTVTSRFAVYKVTLTLQIDITFQFEKISKIAKITKIQQNEKFQNFPT